VSEGSASGGVEDVDVIWAGVNRGMNKSAMAKASALMDFDESELNIVGPGFGFDSRPEKPRQQIIRLSDQD
jgi:hypothetical protein